MIVSIFKSLYKSKDVSFNVPLEKVVERIRDGNSKDLIKLIRVAQNDAERVRLKNELPCILFAGEFKERNGNSLVQHSGLCVLDFDKIPETELEEMFLKITSNPHVIICFRSPSGNGIKAVIKIPLADKETHPLYFKGFHRKFKIEYFDEKNCNVDRVCFEGYDPNIYYNANAIIFDEKAEEQGHMYAEKIPVLPLREEAKIIDKIMKMWDGKYGFVNGKRNNNIYVLANWFCEYGIEIETAIGYIYNNVVIGDFSEAETIRTIKSSYGDRVFNSRYFEDNEKILLIKRDIRKPKEEILQKFQISENIYNEIKEDVDHDDFWDTITDKKGVKKTTINPFKYKIFLERHGFRKYYPENSEQPVFLYIESNKVTQTSVEKIKDFVLMYLETRKEIDIWNYCAKQTTMFTESYLLMIDTIELLMLKDKKESSFIAYNNGILEVTKESVKLVDFIDIDSYIWKRQIIDRDFKINPIIDNDYKSFIFNVSDGKPQAMESVIGYLLSTYKNKMNNMAIILNDEVISQNPEGGTGKGVFIQGIQQIRRVAVLDGKTFDDKKSFPYQTVSEDTQVLVFDDVVKNFSFENKFSLVTEGITLERKNKDAIKQSVSDSPKIVISTNYAIKGEGNSHDRRRFELEFAQYYGAKRTPEDDFKRQLFDDWSREDYLCFDNYMIFCLQSYLNTGLIVQEAKNIKIRKFLAGSGDEFFEWIEETTNFPRNVRNGKGEYFNNFITEYPDFKKNNLSQRKFLEWMDKYCKLKGFELLQGNTQGVRWFEIRTSEVIINNEKPKDDEEIPF